MGPIADEHYSRFQGAKLPNMDSAVQQWCRNADAQESRIQSAKHSEKGPCTPRPQEGWFADAQESRIQVAKGSNIGSADMKGLRFPNAQESRFRTWNRLHMCSFVLQGGLFADIQ